MKIFILLIIFFFVTIIYSNFSSRISFNFHKLHIKNNIKFIINTKNNKKIVIYNICNIY